MIENVFVILAPLMGFSIGWYWATDKERRALETMKWKAQWGAVHQIEKLKNELIKMTELYKAEKHRRGWTVYQLRETRRTLRKALLAEELAKPIFVTGAKVSKGQLVGIALADSKPGPDGLHEVMVQANGIEHT